MLVNYKHSWNKQLLLSTSKNYRALIKHDLQILGHWYQDNQSPEIACCGGDKSMQVRHCTAIQEKSHGTHNLHMFTACVYCHQLYQGINYNRRNCEPVEPRTQNNRRHPMMANNLLHLYILPAGFFSWWHMDMLALNNHYSYFVHLQNQVLHLQLLITTERVLDLTALSYNNIQA